MYCIVRGAGENPAGAMSEDVANIMKGLGEFVEVGNTVITPVPVVEEAVSESVQERAYF